jgi:hypothetical protein
MIPIDRRVLDKTHWAYVWGDGTISIESLEGDLIILTPARLEKLRQVIDAADKAAQEKEKE